MKFSNFLSASWKLAFAIALLVPAHAEHRYQVKDLQWTAAYTNLNNFSEVIGRDSIGVPSVYSHGVLTNLEEVTGLTSPEPVGINDFGQIALYTGSDLQSYLYSHGHLINIGALPGHVHARATGINNLGYIVGDSDGHAFLYRNGAMIEIQGLPENSGASGINNLGRIWGYSIIGNEWHSWIYANGAIRQYGGPNTEILKITDSGLILWSDRAGGVFIDKDGVQTQIEASGYILTAWGVNSRGEVVGRWCEYGGPTCGAFHYTRGKFTNLSALVEDSGFHLGYATDINEWGQISAYGRKADGTGDGIALLLTPSQH